MTPPAARTVSRKLWVLAALGAVAIHGGAIAMVMRSMQEEPTDDANGAPAIEIGLEFTAPKAEQTDLPPGPQADDSAAAPAVVEQKAVAEQSELPKDTPVENENPDRLVTPDASQKLKEDDPTPKAVEAVQSNESVASEAAAPPASDIARKAPVSAAPVQGNGEQGKRVIATWQKQMQAYINRHMRYPAKGARGKAMAPVVVFTIDRTGHVLDVRIDQSSGDPVFDEAALDMLRRSDPIPPPPALLADNGLTFRLPACFRPAGQKRAC